MEITPVDWAEVDEQGRLVLPAEVARQHGLHPGARLRIEHGKTDLRLHRPVTHLAKIYIEPTNFCNLKCRTCMRNVWDESPGRMAQETFQRIVDDIAQMPEKPLVFFGGLGEPLSHPQIINMIAKVKALGARVEMITNGTLLTPRRSKQLIDGGLDVLWVSLDGAEPESYSDVRLGARLPQVIENIDAFRRARRPAHHAVPEIGIAFVAMRRNIHDLHAVINLGKKLGAVKFSVSNVLPYTGEMNAEILYRRTLRNITYLQSPWLPQLSLPKMDLDDDTREIFSQALSSGCNVQLAGQALSGANDVCVFIEGGSLSVGWDGSISPCLPLLHTHVSYLHNKERVNEKHLIGSITDRGLLETWLDPEYVAYRERVQGFGFPPCTFCGGCDLSQANLEDCLGNEFPACGGCLWAQGVIQCP